jgi:hypothetical protein
MLVYFFMVNAFGESLSFAAQKKVTKEKGTLPLLLSRHCGTRKPSHNSHNYWLLEGLRLQSFLYSFNFATNGKSLKDRTRAMRKV